MSSDRDMSPGGTFVVFDLDPEEQADKTRMSERPPITVLMKLAYRMDYLRLNGRVITADGCSRLIAYRGQVKVLLTLVPGSGSGH
jgi:hypothetical protein